ncbi:NADPH-dependent FMN reductase [Sphingobacterium pedocola]|uniref:NADPH-dependent FMN reductase-like domain-containing protein n=1 Tax=Sphingobacterium pedocola TaxID=2082722 RepID=A0ABR9T674_9SPHI|nr:NAD(P)H-dependent oxidoreductase [Sphingobacterium pedocola]MBE8720589.1 hypothetical protein [Sphingobacterium pedocola]
MNTKTIGIVVGSLRKESFNKKVAHFLTTVAPQNLTFQTIEIGDLPLYNQDFDEEGSPESYIRLRKEIKALDAILFVTPEYNRSVPGVLKNALDAASRPYGQNAWQGKPAAVVSVSIGNISGFGANHHLRQSLAYLDMPTMPQPEMYLGDIANNLDEQGNFKDPKTIEFLTSFMDAFANWINKF